MSKQREQAERAGREQAGSKQREQTESKLREQAEKVASGSEREEARACARRSKS